jgi:hypothetical protein
MQDHLIQFLQLMQFWKTESFSLSLANTVIGSDVKINQDSIHGYMGLGFVMRNINEDGSGDVYTFGISMQPAWSSIVTLLHGQNTPVVYSQMISQE